MNRFTITNTLLAGKKSLGAIKSMFKAKTTTMIGVDVSPSAVKMVELSHNPTGQGYVLEQYVIEPLPIGAITDGRYNMPEDISATLRKAWERLRTQNTNVRLAVPEGAVMSKTISCPSRTNDVELDAEVAIRANECIPFALDEVYIDFAAMGPAPKNAGETEVLMLATRRHNVDERVAAAQEAGLNAIAIDAEEFAVQAVFDRIYSQLPEGATAQCVALVDIGANWMKVNMFRNGQSVYWRIHEIGGTRLTQSIQEAFGLSEKEAESAKRQGGLPDNYESDVLTPFMEDVAFEVNLAIAFFAASTQWGVEDVNHIVLAGGCASLPGLDKAIEKRTQIGTVIANPVENMTFSSRVDLPQLQKDGPALMTACSLAMSSSGQFPKTQFNFLPHRAPLTAEQTESGLTSDNPERRRGFASLPNITLTPLQIERGLTDDDAKVRSAFAARADFTPTLAQIDRGLTDKEVAVRDSFASRADFVPTPSQIERGLVDVDGRVNTLVVDAYKMGASDIHIEPAPDHGKTVIRLRKDGSLFNYMEVPGADWRALVNRIRFMCDLDISSNGMPQDGKIQFKKYGPLDIQLRVEVIPLCTGVECATMRILASGEAIPLNRMGFSERNLKLLKDTISKPWGLFLVCGPTYSSKLTTLHSILKYLNTPDRKIWTAEDPVKFTQSGLYQVQVAKKKGLDFDTVMQAILRADPDVIMVSDPRDKEAASIVIDASLSGHYVLSTLYANNAAEAITRLMNLDIKSLNLADALQGILAQRLVKRLCEDCKKAHIATQDEIKSLLSGYAAESLNTKAWKEDPDAAYRALYAEWVKLFGDKNGDITLYEEVGCEKCAGTGYRGYAALHELIVSSQPLKNGIREHAPVSELSAIALEEGMRTFTQDGIEKVLLGITDIRQVRAACSI